MERLTPITDPFIDLAVQALIVAWRDTQSSNTERANEAKRWLENEGAEWMEALGIDPEVIKRRPGNKRRRNYLL